MQTPYTPYPQGQGYRAPNVDVVDPIISRLRPRDMPGILDQAFRLYRGNFLTFLAIVAVVFVPIEIITQVINVFYQGASRDLLTSSQTPRGGDLSGIFTQSIVTSVVLGLALAAVSVIGTLIQYLSQGALTAGIADGYLDRPVSFSRSYREMFKHIGPLLGIIALQILIGIGIFALPVLVILLAFVGAVSNAGGQSSSAGAGAAVCLGFCLFIPAIVLSTYVYTRLRLAVPATIIENLGPRRALRRSWELVQGNWWRTFLLLVVLGIMAFVVSAGPAALVVGLVAFFSSSFDTVTLNIITGAVTVLTGTIFVPIQQTAITLYYFDRRVRKEGFDLGSAMTQYYGQGAYGYPGGYGQGQPGALGQYGSRQPQYGYAQTPSPGMAPPALGNEQPAYGYPPGYPRYAPTRQDNPESPSASSPPTTSYAYNPTDPTQNSWPTPATPPGEPPSSPESTPPGPETDAAAPVPPPEEPYPTPGWLQRPSDLVTPEAEPTTESGPPAEEDSGPPEADKG
jgi:Membrane domain of glycerophosphoryl diester phosphodiesterase